MLWKEKGRKESENGEGEGKREMKKKNWVKEKGKVRAQNCPPLRGAQNCPPLRGWEG